VPARRIAAAALRLSVGACVLWSGVAAAADMAVKGYDPKPCCLAWYGLYFGTYFGSGAGRTSFDGTDTQTQRFVQTVPGTTVTQVFTDNGTFSGSGKPTGSVVDLFVGYNAKMSDIVVVGAQLEGTVFSDITLKSTGLRNSTQTQTTTTVTGAGTTVATTTATASNTFDTYDELRSMFAFVGRAGWLATQNTLLYLLGGGVLGNFVIPESQDPRGGDRSEWKLGYTAGAGVEQRLNKHWSLRAEYRYIHFDVQRDSSTADTQTQGTATTTFTNTNNFARDYETKFDFHLGKIGIVYAFCYCD
jgi:opacity protein-like surface antigen